jgi:hypothetical protein
VQQQHHRRVSDGIGPKVAIGQRDFCGKDLITMHRLQGAGDLVRARMSREACLQTNQVREQQ